MDVMVSLKAIDFSFMLSSNASGPNEMLFDVCTVILCKFEQFLNTARSISS